MSNITLSLTGNNVSAFGYAGELLFLTSKKTSVLSANKLPEFMREEYPALVAFVKAYYRFVERLEGIRDLSDIDSAPQKYISLYKDMVAKGFPDPEFLSVRKFIQANRDFFSRKGTPDAFKFFFRAYFNEEIEVLTPNYLIASGGEISGLYFSYITIQYGTINAGDTLSIISASNTYEIEVQRVTQISPTIYAIYYIPPRGFSIQVGNRGSSTDINGIQTSIVTIVETPTSITISDSGKYWQIGKVVVFPSSEENGTDTIARVTRVDTETGIANLEIIEFGYPHSINQSFTVSPFPAKPAGVDITFDEVVTLLSPRTVTYTIGITDGTQGFTESISGLLLSSTQSDYFLEDYTEAGYTALEVISGYNSTTVIPEQVRSDYTLEMWLNSRATLIMNFGAMSRERPQYLSEKSLISNQQSKLHDNLFYQAFAYSIQTTKNIDEYRGSLELIHPAGMKFSAELSKSFLAYKYIGYGDTLYSNLPYWEEESSPGTNEISTEIVSTTIPGPV